MVYWLRKPNVFTLQPILSTSFFSNLLKDLTLSHAEQVFVSDITYIKVDGGHSYLALVTDAYSENNGLEIR
jgi:hypothetical protein